jgi:hypothetical protein
LKFHLYDTYNGGDEITPTSSVWKVSPDGLVSLKDSDYVDGKGDEYKYQFTGPECNFLIEDAWSYDKTDNQITLTVEYTKEDVTATITTQTNFTFLKEGDPGTNGTGVAIVVTGTPEFEIKNGKKEYDKGLEVTKYIGADSVTIDGSSNIKHISNNVCKATVTEDNKTYYGYYVPPVPSEIDKGDKKYLLVGTPSQYVVYDADGTNPKYSDWKFKKEVKEENKEPVVSFVDVKFVYGTGTNNKDSLYSVIPKTFDSTLAVSEGVF